LGALLCVGTARYITKLSSVHVDFLFPLVMVIVFVAAFITQGQIMDFIVVVAIAVLGFFMKKFGYSRAALGMGFVLGELFEHYLLGSVKVMGPFFFLRPISLVLVILIIGVFTYRPLKSVFRKLIKGGNRVAG
jgi:putative tricarboxylic transport membrane protein